MIEPGFDYSPYLGGTLSLESAQELAGLGLTRACIAIDSSDETYQTCLNCNAAGMSLDAYRELTLSQPNSIVPAVRDALAGFSRLAGQLVYVRRLWLTAEDTGADPATLAASLATAVQTLAGFDIGLYSGDWYWGVYLTDTGQFDSLPKWWADYNGVAGVAQGYAGHQYAGTTQLAGVAVDLDVWSV